MSVALLVASALAGLRADAEAAEAAGDWSGAWEAWRACAAPPSGAAQGGAPGEASAGERRLCEARVRVLGPQAADGFAGWAELEAVRRAYRDLGSETALSQIEAALAAHPGSPAAPEMRLWLLNERQRRGEDVEAEALRAEVAGDPALTTPLRNWASQGADDRARARRQDYAALLGGTLAVGYGLVAARGAGPWRWRSGLVAGALLGGAPWLLAAAYGASDAAGFGLTGLVLVAAVVGAARAPAWVSAPGALGGLLVAAWWNGWLAAVGL